MEREDHPPADRQLTHPAREPIRVVHVLGTMQGHQQVAGIGPGRRGELVLGALRGPQVRVDHDVAHQLGAVRKPFAFEVIHGRGGGRQRQIGEVIGHDPVALLRHERVEGP